MQLEAVGAVAVSHLGFKVGWQVDDVDGIERAFLWADTTSNAEALRDEGNLAVRSDFDAEFAGSHNGTGLFAFLSALLGLALVRVDDGDSENTV